VWRRQRLIPLWASVLHQWQHFQVLGGNDQRGQQYGLDPDPHYISSYATAVQNWTGQLTPGCNNSQGQSTGITNNGIWKSMSIVNGGGTFSYGSGFKGMGGWLCYNSQLTNGSCGAACPNNSGPQGEIFYDQFSASNSGGANGYLVTGIQQCKGAEGVADIKSVNPDNASQNGQQAIEAHMLANCNNNP
jgi:hypothetical protein